MADRLKVFVSSIIDAGKEDLKAERGAVCQAVRAIEIAEPWAFEDAPASPKPLDDSYLDQVTGCDIYVIILGALLSEPVRNEYLTAKTEGKPILIFVRKGVQRSLEVQALLDEADVKYATFQDSSELFEKAKDALKGCIVSTFRDIQMYPSAPTRNIVRLLNKAKTISRPVTMRPTVPKRHESDEYDIEGISSDSITLAKRTNQQNVLVPLSKIRAFFPTAQGSVLELEGRIQWTDPRERWFFFPERPAEDSPYGIPQRVGTADPAWIKLREKLESRGFQCTSCWQFDVPGKEAEGWEVAYSDEGYYLSSPNLFRAGVEDQIFIKKRGQ